MVTGSSSGIEEAIVTLFSRLSAQDVVTGRNADKVSRPLTFVGDLMKDENIEQLVKTVEKHGVSFLLQSISKAAIDMEVKNLALEFGPKGVHVNSVNPGIIKTPASQPYLDDENYLKEAKNYSVFQRVGEIDDIAKAVVFLASNASSFITGTNLAVNGGFLLK
ncbi:short-chain dehydrogenase-like protein [Dinothrombium tinctorium]|uniref:Short-chain dehydrogenase-like protein n=1 Tax=Dinothrombium tinctorium TaxID=1965070 RepID=A0A443Q6H2_9ACAR|nr:short-chain dehydrogenase-like protein [Dinothrombium tinctorium]